MPDQVGKRSRSRRIDFSNNYSTRLSESRCNKGTYPRQHLYGLNELRTAGYEVSIREHQAQTMLAWTSRQLRWRLGDLQQLPRALERGDEDAVDVAAEPYHVALLAHARGRRWRRQPLVTVFHAPLNVNQFSRRLVAGVDVAICLSTRVQEQLITAFGRTSQTTLWAPWGPDLDFGGYRSTGERFVVSSGKTLRDVETLVRALAGTGIPAKVHGAAFSTEEVTAIVARGHLDLGMGREPQLPYEAVLDDLRDAAIVAVPLASQERLAGLSEIADALAMGKPLVVTRSPWLDIDVEKIGCGLFVEPGDVQGWRRALTELWSDPDRRRLMGQAGRAFAERECNTHLFGQVMLAAVNLAGST